MRPIRTITTRNIPVFRMHPRRQAETEPHFEVDLDLVSFEPEAPRHTAQILTLPVKRNA